MQYKIGITLEFIVGCLLGFFGVLVSVSSDSTFVERFITICVILVLYGLLSALFGFLLPKHGWKSRLIFSVPGMILLLYYTLNNLSPIFNPFYLIYIFLIWGFSYFGALIGTSIKIHRQS